MTVRREADITTTHLTVWWYNVTMQRRMVWRCNWCYDKMLRQTYGGMMGNNVTDDMITHLTKRLTINDGGSGSKLEFNLLNSILLVVRDSTPDCHAILDRMQCHRDRMQFHAMLQRLHAITCNVAAIACDCMQCHAVLKKNLSVFDCLSSWKYTGNEKQDWKFAWRVLSRQLWTDLLSSFFSTFSKQKKWEGTLILHSKHVSSSLYQELVHHT